MEDRFDVLNDLITETDLIIGRLNTLMHTPHFSVNSDKFGFILMAKVALIKLRRSLKIERNHI